MRAGISKSLTERRHARRHRSRPSASHPHAAAESPRALSAVQRTRDAGGPNDRASYSCECGYTFVAQVSTTVACPHCQADQVW